MKYNKNEILYGSHFNYRVFFIGYYLSKQIKKFKIETDGTFDSIIIEIGDPSPAKIFIGNLTVTIPFDREFYDHADDLSRCYYYCELLKAGLQKVREIKKIPYEEIMAELDVLVKNNFVYEWNFKNVFVREYNLKVILTSRLTTNDYVLYLSAVDKKKNEIVCKGQVVRTKPDMVHFSFVTKKIQIINNDIIIFASWGAPVISINIDYIIKGVLSVEILPSPYDDEIEEANDAFPRRTLRYDNNDFE